MLKYENVIAKANEVNNDADIIRAEMRSLMAKKSRLNCRKFEPDFDKESYRTEMTKVLEEEQLLKETIILIENNGIIE